MVGWLEGLVDAHRVLLFSLFSRPAGKLGRHAQKCLLANTLASGHAHALALALVHGCHDELAHDCLHLTSLWTTVEKGVK